jgi:hypothetical protein
MNFIPNESSWKMEFMGIPSLSKADTKLWIYGKFQILGMQLDLSADK